MPIASSVRLIASIQSQRSVNCEACVLGELCTFTKRGEHLVWFAESAASEQSGIRMSHMSDIPSDRIIF